MKGPTAIIQEGNLSVPGQAKHQTAATAKEQPSLINISLPAPQFLKLLKKFLSVEQAFHDTKCFKKKLRGKYPTLKVFLFSFYCSRSYVQQYKNSTQSSNFGKLPIYPATLHIQKHVKSLSEKLCIT